MHKWRGRPSALCDIVRGIPRFRVVPPPRIHLTTRPRGSCPSDDPRTSGDRTSNASAHPRMSETRTTRWESKMPYRGIVHLHIDAHSFNEADDALRDLLGEIKKLAKGTKIAIEYEQTHERF